MKQISIKTLNDRRNALLQELAEIRPFVQGSLCRKGITCGNPRCKCAEGERHEAYVLSKKVCGKTVTTHIPRDLLDEVKSWAEEQKRVKKLMSEISNLSEQIIRTHVKEQRRQKTPKSASRSGIKKSNR